MYRRTVIRLNWKCIWRVHHHQHGASPCVPVAPWLPWTSVLPHEQLESPPVSVHQRSEWCRFMRFLLTVMRYHPVQVSSRCRSAYRHHRSYMNLVAHAQYVGLYDAIRITLRHLSTSQNQWYNPTWLFSFSLSFICMCNLVDTTISLFLSFSLSLSLSIFCFLHLASFHSPMCFSALLFLTSIWFSRSEYFHIYYSELWEILVEELPKWRFINFCAYQNL